MNWQICNPVPVLVRLGVYDTDLRNKRPFVHVSPNFMVNKEKRPFIHGTPDFSTNEVDIGKLELK